MDCPLFRFVLKSFSFIVDLNTRQRAVLFQKRGEKSESSEIRHQSRFRFQRRPLFVGLGMTRKSEVRAGRLARPLLYSRSMIQNDFAQHLNNQVRRVIGEELALVREKVRGGKTLKVAVGKAVFFEPLITFKSNCTVGRRGSV